MNIGKAIAAAIAALLCLTAVSCSWYTVDQTERAVVLRNGAVVGLSQPGLHFKLPFIDDYQRVSLQSHIVRWAGNEAMQVYSRDQQPASLGVSVNYRVTDPMLLYTEYKDAESMVSRVLIPQANAAVRSVFGRFNAVQAVQERSRLGSEIASAVRSSVKGPLVIETVQVENIDFSDAYEKSVENRMLAEVEVQKVQQNLQRERVQAEIKVTQATAEAERVRLAGQAEADAIRARGAALRDNPALVELTAAEKWNGILPTTMLPGQSVPFVNIRGQ